MFYYLKGIIENLPTDLHSTWVTLTPEGYHMFEVNKEAVKLDAGLADSFHWHVVKFLFVDKQTRSDIQIVIAFIYTWIHSPNDDKWKNLIWVLG